MGSVEPEVEACSIKGVGVPCSTSIRLLILHLLFHSSFLVILSPTRSLHQSYYRIKY